MRSVSHWRDLKVNSLQQDQEVWTRQVVRKTHLYVFLFNPLSPESDQHEIFPCDINSFCLNRVIERIEDMI